MSSLIYRGVRYDRNDIKAANPAIPGGTRYRGAEYDPREARKAARKVVRAGEKMIYRGQIVSGQ